MSEAQGGSTKKCILAVDEQLLRIQEQLRLYEDDNAEEMLGCLLDGFEKEEGENE